MIGFRLSQGGLVDRSQPRHFRWQGRQYRGFAGDTLASALLANGVSLVGRSFKYHRLRGFLAAGLDEPNAIVQIELGSGHSVPNLKATYVELYEGLTAEPVNAWPSVERDWMAINGLFKRFIPAAFYYKTFMWPHWRWFEPSIRKAAGLGVAPDKADPDSYDHRHAHCDLLIVGGGIAGLKAALAEARTGRSVILVTGSPLWGGRFAGATVPIEGIPAHEWITTTVDELGKHPNVMLQSRTIATGYYDHGLIAMCERLSDHMALNDRQGPRQRLWKVRAKEVVLATGAIERPLVFPGNDIPGVMLAGAALSYLRRHGVAVGRNILVATNNDSAWPVAFELADKGIRIAGIADARLEVSDRLIEEARHRDITIHLGAVPISVRGRSKVRAVRLSPWTAGHRAGPPLPSITADTLLMSGGWNPACHLHSQAGGNLRFDDHLQAFVPEETIQSHRSIGGAAGDFDLTGATALIGDGVVAGSTRAVWSISKNGTPDSHAWVDYQNDVTAADIALAARENFISVEHLKRYTTLGMASDQGKSSNVNGIGIMSELLGRLPHEIGTTRFRPPYDPTTIGVFAGHRIGDGLQPRRMLSAHASHEALGARMEEYGGWMRPAAYMQGSEDERQAVDREVRAVRTGVGLFEASPLGKIEVKGPDAAAFLDRIYVNAIHTLKIGRCRYGLMLNENGIIYDDGIVTRLAEDHFLVGTTSGHAASVAEMLQEWLQCEWTELRVLTQDVTTSWAVINVAGPSARKLIHRLGTDIDLSAQAFPHMSHFEGHITGAPCRISRVSFSGELSYEIAVPWDKGYALWTSCLEAGRDLSITPFGIEALMTMRIEKGFLHIGSDTDGTTLPQDVGFGPLIARKEGDFIGRRSTMRPDGLRDDRRQLVGLAVEDESEPLTTGAHILPLDSPNAHGSDGWVTSSTWSPSLGIPVALAMIKGGHKRLGEKVEIVDLARRRRACIVKPGQYDPTGAMLHV